MGNVVAFLVFLFNFLDGLATYYLMRYTNYEVIEMNPLMLALMNRIGDWFLLVKVLLGLFVLLLISAYWKKWWSVKIASMLVLFIYVAVVVYQLFYIAKF